MRVVIAGGHGLLGSALADHLATGGHDVVRLSRSGAGPASWDPAAGRLDPAVLAGADALVNLGGASLAAPWTAAHRERVVTSRLEPTALLARTLTALAATGEAPKVWLQASAVGWYGDRGDEVLTEESGPGTGFLADLCTRWEAASEPAAEAGIAVAHLRTGVVLARGGGALKPLLPVVRLGLGGPLGPGDNWWPWIALRDHVRAVSHLLGAGLTGPVNLVGPAPARQRDVVRAVARQLRRPAVLKVPAAVLRLVLREAADEMVLASQRALPSRLAASGFEFADGALPDAIRQVMVPRR